jgi:hypothetical protein
LQKLPFDKQSKINQTIKPLSLAGGRLPDAHGIYAGASRPYFAKVKVYLRFVDQHVKVELRLLRIKKFSRSGQGSGKVLQPATTGFIASDEYPQLDQTGTPAGCVR